MSRWLPLVGLGFALGCVVSTPIGKAPDDAASGSETGETGETDTTDGETDTQGEGCSPPPDANACEVCEADHCCEFSQVCQTSDVCVCLIECALEGHSSEACTDLCGDDGGVHSDLWHCLSDVCGAPCGL